MTSNVDLGKTIAFTWDALGRRTGEANHWGTISSTWDLAGRRTRLQHPDGFFVDYDHLVTGETAAVRENGAVSGIGVLAAYAYDDLGRRISLTRGNGTVKSYGYDSASRLASLGEDLAGTGADLTLGFTWTPASRIAATVRSNDTYAWTNHYNLTRAYSSNGLNQYTATGAIVPTYDARGNLTSAGTTTYGYNSDNLLTHKSGVEIANYDGLLRLSRLGSTGQPVTRFNYDGTGLIAEYDGNVSGVALLRRYVHGPGADEPLVWYEGSGTADRRFLHSDERGSIVAVSDGAGNSTAINRYDEYGIPAANTGRFQYTGQTWLPELGMYYYKARIYSPTLGRFLQTDPIGYGDGMNMYAYVGNDPVNFTDPTGLCVHGDNTDNVVCGKRETDWGWSGPLPRTFAVVAQPPRTVRKVHRPTAARPSKDNSTLDKLGRCARAQLGLDDLADVAAAASGFNVVKTRGKFAGATRGTSIASRGASAVFGQAKLPFQVPTIVGNPLTLSAGIRFTSSVARAVGRGIPVLGWGLLAYDAAKIAQCVASDE